jgi:hypothetical protein
VEHNEKLRASPSTKSGNHRLQRLRRRHGFRQTGSLKGLPENKKSADSSAMPTTNGAGRESMNMTKTISTALLLAGCLSAAAQAAFVHPGCLSTSNDLDRMAAKVAASAQPWTDSWNILVGNTDNWTGHTPEAVSTVYVSSSNGSDNYIKLARDSHRAYQLALRYHGDGSVWAADKAVQIMNVWASTHTAWDGDSNVQLRAGLYGYPFACAAELLRDYGGWAPGDFTAFRQYMLNEYYSINSDFLIRLNGTYDMHYWANWTLASAASMMAIGVLCDDQAIFDEAVDAIYTHRGTARMEHAVPIVHPNGLGQWQESGRDQGHTLIGPQLMGVICEIAWNQGTDLYGYLDQRFLAGVEYISKYNTGRDDVPFTTYIRVYGNMQSAAVYDIMTANNPGGRGGLRPGWDLIYNHYVNRMGMAAPYTKRYADGVGPEGGGFNYGSTSGGFDGLGFTTLTHSLDPIAAGAVPSRLRPYVQGRQITLSWAGSAYAQSYNVKRATTPGGPYSTLATVGPVNRFYVDPGLAAGTTCYYVVSANNPDGESADSAEAAATATDRLHGTVIGTDGSWNNAGAGKQCVFDDSLDNYFDAPSSIAWAGLDLGDGVAAVVTQVKYCPRTNIPSRMVGGKFQGSNAADFGSGVVDLYTISSTPATGVLTTQAIANTNSFRYVRYLSPSGGYGNVAEVQFFGDVAGLEPPAPPSAPSLSISNGLVNLSWSASSGATSYNVKRSTTPGGSFVILENVAGTSYVNDQAPEGATCCYVVSALNSAGESANSAETSAVPSADISPEEYEIASHAIADGTNLVLTVSNTVPGHLVQVLATASLTPTDWQPTGYGETGTGSNIRFDIPIGGIEPNRFFKLDVQRQ